MDQQLPLDEDTADMMCVNNTNNTKTHVSNVTRVKTLSRCIVHNCTYLFPVFSN